MVASHRRYPWNTAIYSPVGHVTGTRRPLGEGAPAYTTDMSVQREELIRLVEELPEDEVPIVLDDVRRHLRLVHERPWPPAWFGAAEGRATDTAARSEELLAEGFGYSA